jgi:type II secretory pathway predicted ATPase ExeA
MIPSISNHFNISSIPFLSPTRTPFLTESFIENQSIINSVFFTRQIAAISGSSGSGKTALFNYTSNQLEPSSHRIIICSLSSPNKGGLYKSISLKAGLVPKFYPDDSKNQLIEFFDNENRQGKLNCIVVDECQSFSIPMLEELRCFYEDSANFSLILSGLPSFFSEKLNLSVSSPMKRRIGIFIGVSNLSLNESKNYILHNLSAVNAKDNIFDEKSFPAVHGFTKGIPGKINQLCYASMIYAFKNKSSIVTNEIVTSCSKIINFQ